MLTLLKWFFDKLDFIRLAEAIHRHRNRKAAAQLYSVLVQAYEILEIYALLLDELADGLRSYEATDERHYYQLNPARVRCLLRRQASNLEVLDTLIRDLRDELRILDNEFVEMWSELLPGKFGILLEAESLLSEGRLPLSECGPENFPATRAGQYRTLWFTSQKPDGDRHEIEKYLYGWNGHDKEVIDVNVYDGEAFYGELEKYFKEQQPRKKLAELQEVTSRYRDVMLQQFSLEDVLVELGSVRRHC